MRSVLSFVIALVIGVGCAKNPQAPPDEQPTQPIGKAAAGGVPAAEEVQFEAAGMTIHGTITRPAGEGKFPAIAIAAGSGPTDRDWLSPMLPGENGSATLLAEQLARDGVVLLRYDKRGTGQTGMPSSPIAWGDYAAELSAALEVLAAKDYVDIDSIYVAGHSEGGAHALRVAAKPPVPLAGVILLATAGRSLRDIVLWQISGQIRKSGLAPAAAEAEVAAFTKALDEIAAGQTVDARKVGQLQGVQQFVMALQNPQSIDFARGMLVYDPVSAFANFELPVLVVSGARDFQVDPELDAKPLAEAAKAAGRPTRLVIVEEADHVLKTETRPREQLDPTVGLRYNAPDRELNPAVVSAIVMFVTDAG